MEVDSAPVPAISANHKSEEEVSTNHIEDVPDKAVKQEVSIKKVEVAEKITTNHSKDDEPETDTSTNHKAGEENISNGQKEDEEEEKVPAINHTEVQDSINGGEEGEDKKDLTNNDVSDEKEKAVVANHKEETIEAEESSANQKEAEDVSEGKKKEEIVPLSTNGEVELEDLQPIIEGCMAVVIDIAGTCASIEYVKDTLFAYIITNAETYLRSNWEESVKAMFPSQDVEEAIRFVVEGTKGSVEGKTEKGEDNDEETKKEVAVGDEAKDDGAVKDSKDAKEEGDKALTQDEKSEAEEKSLLKKIQGMILRRGFKNGDLEAKLFPDVAPSIRDWSKMGRRVSVFSTGSVESQRLLFSHAKLCKPDGPAEQEKDKMETGSDEGEETPSSYIKAYLDTENVGSKTEPSSYKKILDVTCTSPEETLFITDDVAEAQAAKSAGLVAFLIERAGNAKLPEGHGFPVIGSFEEILFKTRKETADKMVQTVAIVVEEKQKKVSPPSADKEVERPSDAAAVNKGEEIEKTEPMEELKEKDSKSDEKTEVKEPETSKQDEEKMEEDEESRKRKREETEEGEKGKEEAKEEKRKREEEKGTKVEKEGEA